jgi:hypothetical protein
MNAKYPMTVERDLCSKSLAREYEAVVKSLLEMGANERHELW